MSLQARESVLRDRGGCQIVTALRQAIGKDEGGNRGVQNHLLSVLGPFTGAQSTYLS